MTVRVRVEKRVRYAAGTEVEASAEVEVESWDVDRVRAQAIATLDRILDDSPARFRVSGPHGKVEDIVNRDDGSMLVCFCHDCGQSWAPGADWNERTSQCRLS